MRRSRQINFGKAFLAIGVALILFGMQLRVVESFVLTPWATQALYEQFRTPSSPSKEAIQRIVVESTSPQKTITPPSWLGWAMITAGITLTSFGSLGNKWK